MKSQFLVCIPTYNERENIQKILLRLYASNPEIDALVIDDNSPDGTAQIVKQMQDGNPNLHLLVNPSKSGLGGAYRSGFKWAMDNNYEYVVEMDADGSHQPEQLQALLEKAPTHDLVIGSRWVKGGSVANWPLSRKVLSLGGNFYVQTVLGISVKDATAGFRIYSRSALETLKMLESQSQGYVFQVDGTYRAVINKLKVCEVPIQFVEREIGVSKMSRAIVFEAISQVTVWAIKHRLLRKPIS
jgi:dolichol-phosphate mannosyltransferase